MRQWDKMKKVRPREARKGQRHRIYSGFKHASERINVSCGLIMCYIRVIKEFSYCCTPLYESYRLLCHRSQTAPKDKLWLDLEKTAMNPFSETKSGAQMGTRQRREEEARGHWYESQLGERWARALYSYYNWRTVSPL